MAHIREVTQEEGEEKAKSLGIPYMETSAKTSINVDKAFNSLIEDIASKMPEEEDDDVEVVVDKEKPVDLNSGANAEGDKKSGCC